MREADCGVRSGWPAVGSANPRPQTESGGSNVRAFLADAHSDDRRASARNALHGTTICLALRHALADGVAVFFPSRFPRSGIFPGLALAGSSWLAGMLTLAPARGVELPLLSGELQGELNPLAAPGAPALHWRLVLTNGDSGAADPRQAHLARLVVDGEGTHFEAEVQPTSEGGVTWKLTEARFALGPWLSAAGKAVDLGKLAAAGAVSAAGEGTWARGQVAGRAQLSLKDGKLDDPVHKLGLEGLALDLAMEDLAQQRTAEGQVLTWTGGHYDTIPIGPGRMRFSVAEGRVRIEEFSVGIFGGTATTAAALDFPLTKPEFTVSAQVTNLDVKQLLPFLPKVLSDASGRLDGSLAFSRTEEGVTLGAGRLALRQGESADVRLAPTPGLLSASLPPTVLKYYPGLGQIETGHVPIRADLLEVAFTPEGDEEGRTASVHLAGGPVDPKLKAPIDLIVNVRGPLGSLVKFGTNSRLRFGGEP